MYANDFSYCTVIIFAHACSFILTKIFFRVTEDEEGNVNSHCSSTIEIQDEMQMSRGSKNRSEDSTCTVNKVYVTSNGVSGIDNMLTYNGTNAAMVRVLSSSIVEDKSSDIDVSQSDDCSSSYSEKSKNDSICDSGCSNSLKDESLSKREKSKMLQIHLQKLVISDYGGCVENSRKLVDMSFRDLERKREKDEMRRRRRLKRRIEREQERYSELSRDMEKQRLKNQMEGSNQNERTSIVVSQDIKSGCDDIKPVVEDSSRLADNGISGCHDYPSPIYKKIKKVHKSKKHKNRKLLVPLDLFEMPKATPPSVSPSSGNVSSSSKKSGSMSSSPKKLGTVSSPCKKSGIMYSPSNKSGSMSSSSKKLGTVSSPCKKSGIMYSPSNKSGSMSSSPKKLGTVSSPCKKSGTVSSSSKKLSLPSSAFQGKGSSSVSSSPSHSKKMAGVPSNQFKGSGGVSSSPNGPIGMSVSSSKSKGSSDHIRFKGSVGMSPNPSRYKNPVTVSSAPLQSKGLESSKYKRSLIVSSTSSPFKYTKRSGSKDPATMPSGINDKSLSSTTSVKKHVDISSKSTSSRSQKLLSPSWSDGSGNVLSNYSRSKGSVNFLSSPSWSDSSVNVSSPSRTKDSLGVYSSPSWSDSSLNMFSSPCHDIDSTDMLSSPSQSKKSGNVFTWPDGSVNVLSRPSRSTDSDNISSSRHEDVLSTYTPSEGVFSNLSCGKGRKDVLCYDYSPKCVESLDSKSKQSLHQTDIDEIDDDVFSDSMERETDVISGDDEEEIKIGIEDDGNMDLDAPVLVSITSSIFSLKYMCRICLKLSSLCICKFKKHCHGNGNN